MDKFNDFNQNLDILQEELAEVALECNSAIVQISKIKRFGLGAEGFDNRSLLEVELGEVMAMINLLIHQGIVSLEALDDAARDKMNKLEKYYVCNSEERGKVSNKCSCGD